jgi:DNA helicase-2/ATP-dependent DNA helicase PcrA
VDHLVVDKGVSAESILVSTVTEKAAAELFTFVSNGLAAVGVEVNLAEMFIGTLHSLCLRILDEHRERTRLNGSYALWKPCSPCRLGAVPARRGLRD